MRWGLNQTIRRLTKPRRELTHTERRHRQFKRIILALTSLIVVALIGGTRVGRDAFASATENVRLFALRQFGLEPERSEIKATVGNGSCEKAVNS